MIFVMEPCFSGGFVDDLTDYVTYNVQCKNRVVHTACEYDGPSIAELHITGGDYDEFVFYWTAVARGYYPGEHPWELGDSLGYFPFEDYPTLIDHPQDYDPLDTAYGGNGDDFPQMGEIFDYSNNFDTWSPYGYFCQYPPYTYVENPQDSTNIGFQDDLLSLFGICGNVETTQTISGSYMINPYLNIDESVSLTCGEYTDIYLLDDVKITVEGMLFLSDDVHFHCGEDSRITIADEGDFYAVGSTDFEIIFEPLDTDVEWSGIEMRGIGNRYMQNCAIYGARTGITLAEADLGTFTENVIWLCEDGIVAKGDPPTTNTRTVSNSTILVKNSGIVLYEVGTETNSEFVIEENQIVGNDYQGIGIQMVKCGYNVNIGDNDIYGHKYGINCYGSYQSRFIGNSERSIEENHIGVAFSHTREVVMDDIYVIGNFDYGIVFLDGSHPRFTRNLIKNNGGKELYVNYGHPAMANGHNDIIHESPAGYLAYCYRDQVRSINCQYNYWGSSPPDPEKFYPYDQAYWRYEPWDPTANHPDGSTIIGQDTEARIAYNTAVEDQNNGNYAIASIEFQDIISTYQTSEEALLSLSRIFTCEKESGGNMYGLCNYYEELQNINPQDTVFCVLCRNLAIDCKKESELYEEALIDYANVLESPADEADSTFTEINIIYTLLELENGNRGFSLSHLPERIIELQPLNLQDCQAKTQERLDNLLDNLLGEPEPEEEPSVSFATLHRNYPNPFNPSTTISFNLTAKNAKDAKIEIYNLKGQKVKTLSNSNFTEGNHSVVWNGDDDTGKPVSSGVYFYKLNVNGKSESVRKCLLLK